MSRLERAGISIEVPDGWEGAASGGDFALLSDGRRQPTLFHLASFPLPAERGSFGSGAVERMGSGDVMVVLFEYGSESADTPLFATRGIPRALDPQAFDRQALQHGVQGQSGLQHFFTHNGRAFCLYVVVGSHIDRVELVARVNDALSSLEIE